ncbi:NUDIX domain-containing protein [Kitasatospora sp. NPDC052896]|uniref:NUDIX domain-containing protein n=1 Tax=Kitasatospora sp. NPDC052896 TaxID=3364061 RepID=UPI0037C5FB63
MSEKKTVDAAARDWFADPPQRRLGVLGLFELDTDPSKFLIVCRAYGDGAWGLPGGAAAPNELPRDTLVRVTEEKLGLRLSAARRLLTDYVPVSNTSFEGHNEVFHGVVPEHRLLTLAGGYTEHRFVTVMEAQEWLKGHQLRRFEQAVKALREGTVGELVLGRPVRW